MQFTLSPVRLYLCLLCPLPLLLSWMSARESSGSPADVTNVHRRALARALFDSSKPQRIYDAHIQCNSVDVRF